MARANLGSMSVEALIKLRDEIGKVLNQRAGQLQSQLSRLGVEIGNRSGRSSLKGTKVPVKYRDKQGNTWAGRGAQPVWLREKIKAGAKLDDFAVEKKSSHLPRFNPRRPCVGARPYAVRVGSVPLG